MTDQYYIKRGRIYVPVKLFEGFPADGVWLVKDCGRMSQLIMMLDHKPLSSSALANMANARYDIKELVLSVLKGSTDESKEEIALLISAKLLDGI